MTVTGIIAALIVGLIVGALGRLAAPGRQHIPIWLTMLIGVGAALLGTVLARAIGVNTSGFSFVELLVQIALAALGVAIVAGTAGRPQPGRALTAHSRSLAANAGAQQTITPYGHHSYRPRS